MRIITPRNKTVTEYQGLRLYHFGQSNCSVRVRMTLEEKGLQWTSHHLNLHKGENITPEYFGIHPKGLVPALVHDGVVHIESTDIIGYLDAAFPEPPLRPSGDSDEAEAVTRWMRIAADNHIHVKTYMFAYRLGRRMAKSQADLATYRERRKTRNCFSFTRRTPHPKDFPARGYHDPPGYWRAASPRSIKRWTIASGSPAIPFRWPISPGFRYTSPWTRPGSRSRATPTWRVGWMRRSPAPASGGPYSTGRARRDRLDHP